MANVNNPHGFRPLMRSISGGPGAACLLVHKLAGYGTALFIGDAVCKVASGVKSYPAVSAAITPGATPVFGVNLMYGAASKQTDHLIIPVNEQVFECQEDGTMHGGANLAAVDINMNANVVLTAGNALTQISKHQIAGSTIATTNTLDLHILQLLQTPDNAFGAYARVEVVFNNKSLSNQVAGV